MLYCARPTALTIAALVLSACEHVGPFEPFREVSCFEAAKISLTDAIAVAEADGGQTLDADYRQNLETGCLAGNPGAYDVTVFQAGRIDVVSVDARSGSVVQRESAGVLSALLGTQRFVGSPSDMVRLLPSLSVSAKQAIGNAEQSGGKAMVAWVEEKDGVPGYTIKLVERGRVQMRWVDGRQQL